MLEDKIRHVLEDPLPQEAKLLMFRRRASVYRFREIVQVKQCGSSG